MAIDQYSRVKHKRTQVSGATPTIGPSDDHTDGTWVNNDIYPGEFFLDMGGQVGWFGYSGTSSGVGVWMSGDTSVGSVTAGEFLSSEQIGANIIISYTGTSKIFGGYVYNYYDFTIPAGVNIFDADFYPPESFVGVTATEAHILFIDSVTYESYYTPLNNGLAGEPKRAAAWHYNGANYDRLVGGSGFLGQDAIREQNSFGVSIAVNMYVTDLANGGISFRVLSGAGFPSNDCKGRLIFKFRRTPI
jgi:hypothetical protein